MSWYKSRNVSSRDVWQCTHEALLFQVDIVAWSHRSHCSHAAPRCPFRKSCASMFWVRQRVKLWVGSPHVVLPLLHDKDLPMPVPIACPVSLAPEEHARVESLVRAHSTPQAFAFRCRLILRTAAPDRPSNLQVATEMACERHTVGRWRQRYLAHGLNGLQDAPRSGRPRRVSPL